MPQMIKPLILAVLVSGALLALAACSSPNNGPSGFNTDTGKHAPQWNNDHRTAFLSNPAICTDCHGADLKGGVSNVSCFSASISGMACHANGPNGHSASWSSPDAHGAIAKGAPGTTFGFSLCQICHGNDFVGGFAQRSCLNTTGCHGANVNAPHSPKPWRGATRTHTNTDPGNAPVCATCHTNGANSSLQPSPSAPAGTAPGCFNNTLCHATPSSTSGHPAGWALPPAHGTTAKAAPGATSGFSLCQSCHGSGFTGGIALQTCLNTAGCHGAGVNSPHSPKPWRGGTYTHTTTDQGNAPVCATCHTNGANSSVQPSPPAPAGTAPGCFNNTLCHATPATAACGTCHGIPPNGASLPNAAGSHAVHFSLGSYIACASCHFGAGSGTVKHQDGTVDVAFDAAYNAKSGAASFNSTAATCSNVSCHGGQTTPGWLSGAVININTQCTSCHTPGTTQYNSNNSGHHSTHASQGIACYTCHDITLLAANHFTNLNTTAMEGPASATLRSQIQYNGTSCNPSAGGLTGCHSSHTW